MTNMDERGSTASGIAPEWAYVCSVVRDGDGNLWGVSDADPKWGELMLVRLALGMQDTGFARRWTELDRNHGPLTPAMDAGGRPAVRVAGDLTARHIGRTVRVTHHPRIDVTAQLRGIREAPAYLDGNVTLGLSVGGLSGEIVCTLDTQCEVLG